MYTNKPTNHATTTILCLTFSSRVFNEVISPDSGPRRLLLLNKNKMKQKIAFKINTRVEPTNFLTFYRFFFCFKVLTLLLWFMYFSCMLLLLLMFMLMLLLLDGCIELFLSICRFIKEFPPLILYK